MRRLKIGLATVFVVARGFDRRFAFHHPIIAKLPRAQNSGWQTLSRPYSFGLSAFSREFARDSWVFMKFNCRPHSAAAIPRFGTPSVGSQMLRTIQPRTTPKTQKRTKQGNCPVACPEIWQSPGPLIFVNEHLRETKLHH